MKLETFEDIEAWQKARAVTREIYRITAEGRFSRDFGLKDQMRRASVSIMSDIAEGFERGGNKEFRQFLYIAKASSAELKSQLYVALDVGYIDQKKFNSLYLSVDETSRIIGGFIRYLTTSTYKGTKFK